MNFWTMISEFLKKIFGGSVIITTTTTTTLPGSTTTTTTTALGTDYQSAEEKAAGLDLTKCATTGQFKPTNAKIDTKLSKVTMTNGSLYCEWVSTQGRWKMYDAYCDGLICAAWMENSAWKTAYLDWKGAAFSNYTWGDTWNNVYNGYNAQIKKGDKVGIYLLSYDQKCRTNTLFVTCDVSKSLASKVRSMVFKPTMKLHKISK